ncbi:MAG: hypothetical protein KDD53_11020, partial [Bdellovibrionales bacterium]|nr:hypothetical protein [Bdellovibrionales bacterium]
MDLNEYISKRFPLKAPVRMAVIPFSVPANLSGYSDEHPSVGSKLAWKIHSLLLTTGRVPIVEVFNRQDWPGKKEEFFVGNFGAISNALEAEYDLVLIGYVEPLSTSHGMTIYSKVIDVDGGITVFYGRIDANTVVDDIDPPMVAAFNKSNRRP